MKNLKKVLSLALAFAMVLGLCVTGMAAEDVTTAADWDSVTDKDSALLLNAFEIMEGSDEDGVLMFNPEGNVTRAQAAAMISRALWGGTDNPSLYANGNAGGYVDVVSGAWYMGYVNYMTVIGVMTGKGDGEFDPDGNVTGYELLKMALVAVGYDAEAEKLTGLGWDLRTMALATQRGYTNLTAGTTVTDWNAPLSRMNAAIIIANMIYREMVAYDEGKVVVITYDNDGIATTPAVEHTFATYVLGMTTKTGRLLANEYGVYETVTAIDTTDPNYKGENAVVEIPTTFDADGNPTAWTNINVTMTSDVFDLGGPVVLYYVDEGTDNETLVSASVGTWTAGSLSYHATTGAVTNYETNGTDFTDNSVAFGTTGGYAESVIHDNNNNGKAEYRVTVNYAAPVEVTDVVEDETYGTVYMLDDNTWNVIKYNNGNLDEGVDFIFAENVTGDVVKGTWIVITTNGTTAIADNTWIHAYALTEVEGSVTRVQRNPGSGYDTIYLDGVQFTTRYGSYGLGGLLNYGAEGIFYFAPNETIVGYSDLTPDAADPTYAVIYNTGYESWGSDTAQTSNRGVSVTVSAILEDGTNKIFDVNSVYYWGDDTDLYYIKDQNKDTLTGTDSMINKNGVAGNDGLFKSGGLFEELRTETAATKYTKALFVQYTLNEDGTINIILETVTHGITNTTVATVQNNSTVTTQGNYLTADTVSFVCTNKADNVWSIVKGTGLAVGDYKGTILTDTYLAQGTEKVTHLVAIDSPVRTGTTATFYYIIENRGAMGKNDSGATLYEVVYFNASTGEVVTVETTDDDVSAGAYYLSIDADGEFQDPITTWYTGFATTVTNGIIAIQTADHDGEVDETEIYELTNDTIYFLIDGENSTEIDLADIEEQNLEADIDSYGSHYDLYKTMVYDAVPQNAQTGDGFVEIVIVYADTQWGWAGGLGQVPTCNVVVNP